MKQLYNQLISEKIRSIRISKKMSLRDVGSKAGLAHTTILKYESGRPVDIDKLFLVCNALDIDMIDFLSQISNEIKTLQDTDTEPLQ